VSRCNGLHDTVACSYSYPFHISASNWALVTVLYLKYQLFITRDVSPDRQEMDLYISNIVDPEW
jgi:hypothetical protein